MIKGRRADMYKSRGFYRGREKSHKNNSIGVRLCTYVRVTGPLEFIR